MDDKFYENARGMFLTEGWKQFTEEVDRSIETIRVENIEDEKAFWMAKGQLQVLHRIAGYENLLHHMEKQEEEDA